VIFLFHSLSEKQSEGPALDEWILGPRYQTIMWSGVRVCMYARMRVYVGIHAKREYISNTAIHLSQ